MKTAGQLQDLLRRQEIHLHHLTAKINMTKAALLALPKAQRYA